MGFSISWLAVKGKPAGNVVQELGLTPTGERTTYGKAFYTARTQSNEWFLCVINQCEHDFVKPKTLAALSSACEIIACSIEEHVMVCSSERWQDGANIWRVEHDAQKGIDHISKSGTLPEGYIEIEKEFTTEQEKAGGIKADSDYFFEIPLQIAKRIVGFKHDEPYQEVDNFEVFVDATRPSPPNGVSGLSKKPWWKLW